MVDQLKFRNGMSFLGGAVNIITTQGETGQFGFTASAVCSVTDSPPTLLVCMNRSSRQHPHFLQNSSIAVNVLKASDQPISQVFANPKIECNERFNHGTWTTLQSGAPILESALVSFDCEIVERHEVGTHTIFYSQILDIHFTDQTDLGEEHGGLIYFNRHYHAVRRA